MAARPVARGGGSARASFGSKGDGLLLGWEMVKKAVLFVFTGLYRWLWKVASACPSLSRGVLHMVTFRLLTQTSVRASCES